MQISHGWFQGCLCVYKNRLSEKKTQIITKKKSRRRRRRKRRRRRGRRRGRRGEKKKRRKRRRRRRRKRRRRKDKRRKKIQTESTQYSYHKRRWTALRQHKLHSKHWDSTGASFYKHTFQAARFDNRVARGLLDNFGNRLQKYDSATHKTKWRKILRYTLDMGKLWKDLHRIWTFL